MTKEKDVVHSTAKGLNIRWDDANIKSSYANIGTATANREEFFLLFGSHQNWRGRMDGEEVTVQLENRIVMSPYASKRLMIILKQSIDAYEKQFGEISV